MLLDPLPTLTRTIFTPRALGQESFGVWWWLCSASLSFAVCHRSPCSPILLSLDIALQSGSSFGCLAGSCICLPVSTWRS